MAPAHTVKAVKIEVDINPHLKLERWRLTTGASEECRVTAGVTSPRACGHGHIISRVIKKKNGHVISWQQRDVNRPPDPALKLTAVAFFGGVYRIGGDNQVGSRG
jgi:hypothetical protein